MTKIADRYRTLADAFESKVAAVPSDAWSNRSPCSEWDARQLVGHVVGVHGMMIKPLGRQLSSAPSVDEDPLGAFQSARADLEAVLDDPQLAGTEYDGAFGRSRVEQTVDQFMAFDLVVHGWDLARATGQDETIDPAEVDSIMEFAEPMGDTMREHSVTGPVVDVPGDAPKQDRMLGLLGRDPS